MKKLYWFLQALAIPILAFLLMSNWLPLFYERRFGLVWAVEAIWLSFAFSAAILALAAWWLYARWGLERPWAMSALTFGSVMGVMNFGCALLAVYGLGNQWLASTIGLPSFLFQACAVGAMLLNVFDAGRLQGAPRPN